MPVSALAKWKTTLQLVALGALILGGAVPHMPWVHEVGIVCLWAAAALTLVTGYAIICASASGTWTDIAAALIDFAVLTDEL